PDYTHALPAATRRSLEQYWITELRRYLGCVLRIGDRFGCARYHGNAMRNGKRTRRGLAAHCRDCFSRWSNDHETRIANGASEPFALGQESVAGMDRLCALAERSLDYAIAEQIALR